jgi:hypothetical protein
MAVNGSLKFLSKLSTAVPKSTLKRHTNKSYENSSHQELRDPKDVPQITKNPTQKTELESETERARNGSQQHRLRLPDYLLQYRGLSANRETTRTESSENRLISSIFRFAAKSSPTATKLGEHDHKAVGELPLRGHRPI